jgi:hypothetical protein
MKSTRRRFTREFRLEGGAAAGEWAAAGGCGSGAGGGCPSHSALAGPGEGGCGDGVSGQWPPGPEGGEAAAAPAGGDPPPGGARFPKKSDGVLREDVAVRHQAVGAAPRGLSVARRCELLEVSRNGYYAAQRRPASARALVNQQLVVEIRRIHREVDRTYGSLVWTSLVLIMRCSDPCGLTLSQARVRRRLSKRTCCSSPAPRPRGSPVERRSGRSRHDRRSGRRPPEPFRSGPRTHAASGPGPRSGPA